MGVFSTTVSLSESPDQKGDPRFLVPSIVTSFSSSISENRFVLSTEVAFAFFVSFDNKVLVFDDAYAELQRSRRSRLWMGLNQ